ncbi:MAG: hypothetical protein JOZ53_08265 [Planctomycetaceae bacterium]|nr:hypothetical protein [Planctomycetaceae bacterium]
MNGQFAQVDQERALRGSSRGVIFFFVAFNLISLTEAIMLKENGVRYTSLLGATIGALVAGKVLLAVDLLPFVNRSRGEPLIYNTLKCVMAKPRPNNRVTKGKVRS